MHKQEIFLLEIKKSNNWIINKIILILLHYIFLLRKNNCIFLYLYFSNFYISNKINRNTLKAFY